MYFYIIFYMLMNFIKTGIIYKFIISFIEKKIKNKYLEITLYFMYFVIVSIIYLFINRPVIILTLNLLVFLMLLFNDKISFEEKITFSIFIYLTMLFSEIIFLTNQNMKDITKLYKNEYINYINILFLQMIVYLFLLVIRQCKKIKYRYKINNYYIVIISTLSVIMSILIISFINIYLSLSIIIIVFLNMEYICNKLILAFNIGIKNNIVKKQNELYKRQLISINNLSKKTKSIKHDYRNHLSIIKVLADVEDIHELKKYINKICEKIEISDKLVFTNNIIIDSILNFKIEEIKSKNINYEIDVNIPKELEIDSVDITTILSNIIDNAIEATNKVDNFNERFIKIYLEMDDNKFIIKIMNTYNGILKYKNGEILSTKNNFLDCGIGISNVRNVVQKYKGIMDINFNNKQFFVEISITLS